MAATLRIPSSRLEAPIEPGLYVLDASDLRIHPGTSYPEVIEVDFGPDSARYLRFERVHRTWTWTGAPGDDNRLGVHFSPDRDLIATDYRTPSGSEVLRLFND